VPFKKEGHRVYISDIDLTGKEKAKQSSTITDLQSRRDHECIVITKVTPTSLNFFKNKFKVKQKLQYIFNSLYSPC